MGIAVGMAGDCGHGGPRLGCGRRQGDRGIVVGYGQAGQA